VYVLCAIPSLSTLLDGEDWVRCAPRVISVGVDGDMLQEFVPEGLATSVSVSLAAGSKPLSSSSRWRTGRRSFGRPERLAERLVLVAAGRLSLTISLAHASFPVIPDACFEILDFSVFFLFRTVVVL